MTSTPGRFFQRHDELNSESVESDANSLRKSFIGLDFGTSSTSMARSNNFKVDILHNDRNETQTPSIVAFDGGRILIGDETTASTIRPENIIFGIKRILGCSTSESKRKMRQDNLFLVGSEPKCKSDIQKPIISVETIRYNVEQIVAILFSKLKATVESKYGILGGAVLTVPSSFEPSQRSALMNVAAVAEISVLQLIDETTAAAIAIACKKKVERSRNILIFHLGGGFIDVAVFSIAGYSIKLLSSVSSCDIGGDDFTEQIMEFFLDKKKNSEKKKSNHHKNKLEESIATMSPSSFMQLRRACEKAKKDLSVGEATEIKFREERQKLFTADFDGLSKQLLKGTRLVVDKAIAKSKLDVQQIDNYFMIGRFTVMPSVKRILKSILGEYKRKDIVNAGDAAVTGAAILAEFLSGQSDLSLHLDINASIEQMYLYGSKESKKPSGKKGKLNIKITVREVRGVRYSKSELIQMANDVKALSAADETWRTVDEEITRLTEELHRQEDKIDELLSKVTGNSVKKELLKLQNECKALDKDVGDDETITGVSVKKYKSRLQAINTSLSKLLNDIREKEKQTGIQTRRITDLNKARNELGKKINVLLHQISEEFERPEIWQTKEYVKFKSLQESAQTTREWINNAENATTKPLEDCQKAVEDIEVKLKELMTMRSYTKTIRTTSKQNPSFARFSAQSPRPIHQTTNKSNAWMNNTSSAPNAATKRSNTSHATDKSIKDKSHPSKSRRIHSSDMIEDMEHYTDRNKSQPFESPWVQSSDEIEHMETEVASGNMAELQEKEKSKIDLERKTNALLDYISAHLNSTKITQTAAETLKSLQQDAQNVYLWMCNAKSVTMQNLEWNHRKVERTKEHAEKLIGMKESYQQSSRYTSNSKQRENSTMQAKHASYQHHKNKDIWSQAATPRNNLPSEVPEHMETDFGYPEEMHEVEKLKIELDRKINAISDSISDERKSITAFQTRKYAQNLNILLQEAEKHNQWICNAGSITKEQLEQKMKTVEGIEENLKELIRKKKSNRVQPRDHHTSHSHKHFSNVVQQAGTSNAAFIQWRQPRETTGVAHDVNRSQHVRKCQKTTKQQKSYLQTAKYKQ